MKLMNLLSYFIAVLLCMCCLASCCLMNKQFGGSASSVEVTEEGSHEDTNNETNSVSSINGIVFVSNGDGTCCVKEYNDNIGSQVVIPAKSPNGDKVTSISQNAFKQCTSITSMELPQGINSIGDEAFRGCKNLTSINIPKSVATVGKDVFYGCPKLVEEKDGVLYVDNWVVDCDTLVTQVNIKPGTKGISEYAFAECTVLKSVVISDGVTMIGSYAFKNCTSLSNVLIYSSVTNIEWGAFMNCSSIRKFYYTGTMSEWQTINIDIYVSTSNGTSQDAREWYKQYKSEKENGPLHTASIVYNYVPEE